jgi:DNA/RNA-binding domain of Phe-tRNA-synthetase-like protein
MVARRGARQGRLLDHYRQLEALHGGLVPRVMDALPFQIHDAILKRHPEILVGGFLVEDLHVAAAAAGRDLDELFQGAVSTLTAAGINLDNLTSEPRIAAWRSAIAASGLRPSRYRSSAEQLARRLLKDGAVRTPLPIVSLYCALSAKHLSPLGAYDLDRMPPAELTLRLGRPETDAFLPLGGDPADMPVTEQVVVYTAGDRVLCWAYNVRDSRETCLTADTERAVFFGEAVDECQHEALRGVLGELSARLTTLGAKAGETLFFDRRTSQGRLGLLDRGSN